MKATSEQIELRMPVWDALSEFFLDTKLTIHDYRRIAEILAGSTYSVTELYNILVNEVYPVLKVNLLGVAGEWNGFDREWLRDRIEPFYGKRSMFGFALRHRWMYLQHWKPVAKYIVQLRALQTASSIGSSSMEPSAEQ